MLKSIHGSSHFHNLNLLRSTPILQEYVHKLLTRTYLRHHNALSRNRPKEEDSESGQTFHSQDSLAPTPLQGEEKHADNLEATEPAANDIAHGKEAERNDTSDTPRETDANDTVNETANAATEKEDEVRSAPAPASQGKQPARKSILTGNSIGAILNQSKNIHDPADSEHQAQETEIQADPDCEKKIAANKVNFINEVHRERPRIAMALEEMVVSGNRISLDVPTETLYEEIMRNRAEILAILAEVAGVEGRIEFDVRIAEDNKARKPVKVEDKLKFLTEKNPALTALRKELNLEIE